MTGRLNFYYACRDTAGIAGNIHVEVSYVKEEDKYDRAESAAAYAGHDTGGEGKSDAAVGRWIFHRGHDGHGTDGGERIYAGECCAGRFCAGCIGCREAEEDSAGVYGEASP